MENELSAKRRLVIILVVVSLVIFGGLVWLISAIRPWQLLAVNHPSVTNQPPVLQNCTYPVAYWKDHSEFFPAQLTIGGVVYRERELKALLSDDTQDLAQRLRAQLVAVFLNGQAGANQSSIEAVAFEAYGWLERHPSGSPLTQDELYSGANLVALLEAYNLGVAGISPCDTAFSAPESGPILTATWMTTTHTYSRTITATLNSSATLNSPTSLLPSEVGPSTTPIPTTQRPGEASHTPSRTPASHPSDTPVNTTQAPSNTPIPPTPTSTPRPSFTPPPLPTNTFTPMPTFTPPPLPTATSSP